MKEGLVEIGLSLGSNLGDRLENLKQARQSISAVPGIREVAFSAVYETDPVDVSSEYAGIHFLNVVVIISTDMKVESLLDNLIAIERKLGRQQSARRNLPRPIDIDIIFAGNTVVRENRIEIPHPRWNQRRFVVQPLAEIRPDLRIPGESRTVAEVLLALPAVPKVVFFTRQW